ncbi:MAG TPA: adenylosuccinate lyase [Myxococcota bacterium]|nr:adenylosuccinate lyase [Myxococcota bacterium]HOH76770.1 adenylosuccinate lyase [Myxococcota bacterium]
MIDRYSTPRMREVWSSGWRWNTFLEVELAYLEALEEEGIAPGGDAARIRASVKMDPERIDELEGSLRHDVIAFLTHVEEQAGDVTRFVHFGLTSSDMLDTVSAIQLNQACGYVREELSSLEKALMTQADRHRKTAMVGRTHGMHAEATSFGLVLLGWREMVVRAMAGFDRAVEGIRFGKLAGAVGNLAFGDPEREARVLARFGLKPEPAATQIVARDRHATLFSSMAVAGSVIDHIALNIRHLQRTEVGEAQEPFGGKQRGSSAMPHKKNPIGCENVCGQARLLRGYALAALEDVALWHERDISHSSVERVIGPDATATLEYIAKRLAGIVDGLVVHEGRMGTNLESSGGVIHSEGLLLELVRAGLKRQQAYGLVQRAAMKYFNGEGTFRDNLVSDPEVAALLTVEQIDGCFSLDHHLRWVDSIFDRRTRN